MGYFRDDPPLSELILDEKGQKELDALWDEFDFVAGYTARTYIEFFFNQSGEVLGNGRESGSPGPPTRTSLEESVILDFKKAYLAKAAADEKNNPVAFEAIADHFERVNAAIRSVERKRLEAEPRHLDALLAFAARAYRRPLTRPSATISAFYRTLREKSGLTHEEAMRDSIVSVLMSPHFCLPRSIACASRRAARDRRDASDRAQPLSDYALASRLSYFLWSSMPDAELLARAAAGDLRNEPVLIAPGPPDAEGRARARLGHRVRRQLARLPALRRAQRRRPRALPEFTNELRAGDVRGAGPVYRRRRPQRPLRARHVCTASHTFVNPVLAKHYGMPEVYGSAERVGAGRQRAPRTGAAACCRWRRS